MTGPLARTVADAAAMLDAMCGAQPGDPTWAPPPPRPFLAEVGRDPGRLTVGRYVDNVLGAPVDPACRRAWEEASALLTDLGHDVVDVPPPALAEQYGSFVVLWSTMALATPLTAGQEERIRPLTRWLRGEGQGHSAVDYVRALSALQVAARAHLAGTWQYDAVLTPTLAQPPAPVGGLRDDAEPRHDFAAQGAFTPYTAIYNMTGQPAVSVPLHRTEAGLPIGIQLVGRSADEATLLRLAAQLEAARPWVDAHPPIWSA